MARDLIALRKQSPMDRTLIRPARSGRAKGRQAIADDMVVGMVRQVLVVGIVRPW